jgi:hypothetical protein
MSTFLSFVFTICNIDRNVSGHRTSVTQWLLILTPWAGWSGLKHFSLNTVQDILSYMMHLTIVHISLTIYIQTKGGEY